MKIGDEGPSVKDFDVLWCTTWYGFWASGKICRAAQQKWNGYSKIIIMIIINDY